jgi:predicted Zn-dependent peptidase
MFKKIVLPNGLRTITVPQKSSQSATALILVGTGSKYETKEVSGISHFLEHMFFKGTKKRPDKMTIAETLDEVGGMYNAFTGEEYTGYFAKVASSKIDLALDWVSDIFLNSLLPAKELDREKGVIVEEINMIQDNPMAYVEVLWAKLLYGDQPAGWDIAGTKETVRAIDRQKLQEYMDRQYVAQNTLVCLSGNIEEAKLVKKVKDYFSKIKKAGHSPKPKVIERQTSPELLLHFKETDQTHLSLGARGFNLSHPQRYSQEILGVILGGMMSSRLFMEIREKLGLAYYVRASVDSNPDTGYLTARAGVDNANVEKAISTILKEFKKVSQIKVPASELKKAKEFIKGKMALLLESSDELASFYAGQELLEKRILTPKEIYDKIDKVRAEDVLTTAKTIFQPSKLNLALVGPFKDKEKFSKLLKI